MTNKIYISTKNNNTKVEFGRFSKKFLFEEDIKTFPASKISEVTLIAIDKPKIKDLFLPFKKKILYRLEYKEARKIKFDIFFYAIFFDEIFEWDSSFLPFSKSYLPFFPVRVGIFHEIEKIKEKVGIEFFISNSFLFKKEKLISVVVSKKSNLIWQRMRLKMIDKLSKEIDELEIYGRGFKTISDKSQALIRYKYNIAIENSSSGPSEKLWDPLLCECIVFYGGSLDLIHPLIREAIIKIDIFKPHESLKIIKNELKNEEKVKSISSEKWKKIKNKILELYTFENTISSHLKFYFK